MHIIAPSGFLSTHPGLFISLDAFNGLPFCAETICYAFFTIAPAHVYKHTLPWSGDNHGQPVVSLQHQQTFSGGERTWAKGSLLSKMI
jgi:hypothetical protein